MTGNTADEVWTGSKRQKDELRAKFNGRCGYCGEVMDKMHADHIQPVIRLTTDPWGTPLPATEQRMLKPERNSVANMMPACASCNLSKGGHTLEGWRDLLQRSAQIVAREKSIFRAGVRFGIIKVEEQPVVFHFERTEASGGPRT
ncbi:HNH endonuclease [Seohaeicola nanhaiensis]|uniref:HNH endonuclease n=1 Tax=Seohaeicola nanhaiensis TaxID=1387282 RepID=A0ABV9KEV0_9RHOB